jgi:hypothetical protein
MEALETGRNSTWSWTGAAVARDAGVIAIADADRW